MSQYQNPHLQQSQELQRMAQIQQMQQMQQQQALQQQYQQLLQYQQLQQQPQQDATDANDNFSEESVYSKIYSSLSQSASYDDVEFAKQISNLSTDEQFICTMQRWSYQIGELEKSLKYIQEFDANQNNVLHIINMLNLAELEEKERQNYDKSTRFENIRLPIGSYIKSPTNEYYLNLGIEAKTLQGCLYIGTLYQSSFISEIISSGIDNQNGPNFAKLIAKYSNNPQVAIKYYDKSATDLGITLSGIPVKEKPIQEIRITRLLYRTASISKVLSIPILPWLQEPRKNIIKLIDHWEDEERSALFMVTEFANCGELLVFIDRYHSLIYRDKKLTIQKIDEIKSSSLRDLKISVYRNELTLSKDGFNAYIEFIRYIFQQMVQALHTLHCQGVVHLDISCENFVLHFDENGQFLVKLIDFGRATKLKKKPGYKDSKGLNELDYENKYDFMVSTYTGKCRYMSPESALFLKYKNATPYHAGKEDVYSLGIVLFCMLTCTLPYNTPFYIQKDLQNPSSNIGFLNGDKNCKINLKTLCDINNPSLNISLSELDSNFATLFQKNGVFSLLKSDCILDYVTYDALDLLNKMFLPNKQRISLKELINHPFVTKPPNPQLLMRMIKHVADYKRLEFTKQQENMDSVINDINNLYSNRIHIQAKYIFYLNKQTELKQQYLSLFQQQSSQQKQRQEGETEKIAVVEPKKIININKKEEKSSEQKKKEQQETNVIITSSTDNDQSSPTSSSSTPKSLFPTMSTSSIRSESSNFMQSINASLTSSLNTSINLAVHEQPGFASPSPPPAPTYTCSPSPEMCFSPSPDIISVSSHSNPTSPEPYINNNNNNNNDNNTNYVSINSMNDNNNDNDNDKENINTNEGDDNNGKSHTNIISSLLETHFFSTCDDPNA